MANIISTNDKVTLDNWLAKDDNRRLYNKIINKDNIQDKQKLYSNIDTDKIYKRLESKILEQQEKPVIPLRRKAWFKYASVAVVAGILALGYFFRDNIFTSPIKIETPIIVNNNIETGTNKATLTLENGFEVALVKGQSYVAENISSNGEEIIYNTDNVANKGIAYNYLTIPRGGQFQMTLADGTQVWLNSDSQIRYPVSFIDGETREVELVYGEVYFDVSPSTEHKGSKFKVIHHAQEVTVLGTEFNIKAYNDETNIYTTLVEGEVAVSTASMNQILAPSDQSNLDTTNNHLTISKVDVKSQISWRNGLFSFKGKSLKEIMKVLSRWYDFDVIFEDEALGNLTFKGVLGKDQNIKEILSTIKTLSIINNYEINNKTITLK